MSPATMTCHPVPEDEIWSSERISRFWDLVSEESRLESLYFGYQAAPHLIRFAELAGLTRADNVLDYGCGPGHLARALVDAGYQTTGLEFSQKSADALNAQFRETGQGNWKSCQVAESFPTPLASDAYSFVFTTEAYEHLLDEWIAPYFAELHRVMRPGGRLLLTTPSEENLNQLLIICPVCESKFHRWGHIRACRCEDLVGHAKGAGLQILYAKAIDVTQIRYRPVGLLDTSLRQMKSWLANRFHRICETVVSRPFPTQWDVRRIPRGSNLVLVAEKPPSR